MMYKTCHPLPTLGAWLWFDAPCPLVAHLGLPGKAAGPAEPTPHWRDTPERAPYGWWPPTTGTTAGLRAGGSTKRVRFRGWAAGPRWSTRPSRSSAPRPRRSLPRGKQKSGPAKAAVRGTAVPRATVSALSAAAAASVGLTGRRSSGSSRRPRPRSRSSGAGSAVPPRGMGPAGRARGGPPPLTRRRRNKGSGRRSACTSPQGCAAPRSSPRPRPWRPRRPSWTAAGRGRRRWTTASTTRRERKRRAKRKGAGYCWRAALPCSRPRGEVLPAFGRNHTPT
mmetsp:Transcript_30621/g.68666  ORF Transcript_30621/g.68666 Transcript_30621/m.68666 type:complete len:280 (+) Transcript_30621:98-937(+)